MCFLNCVYPCFQALIAAVCCVMVSGTRAVNSFALKDQAGAESASKLYRQTSGLVYASAAPYGAYSFQIPAISAPQGAASRIVPVKESFSLQHANGNGYLKDSYGNRFVEMLQSMKSLPFKPFPQQYVQLQELPAHFAQPLSAAPVAAYSQQQYKQAPQVFGAHYRLPLQHPSPTPLNQHYSFPHGGVYADAFKNLSPASISYGPHFGSVIHVPVHSVTPTREAHKNVQFAQDSSHSLSENQEHRSPPHHSGHRTIFIHESQPHERDHYLPGEQKFQRLQDAPRETSSEEDIPSPAPIRQVKHKATTHELVSAIKEIPITAVVNGKKTIVNVDTKPPLPLLDINLLEPLTFANPLVPQVQHFLPRIHEATYHKLPDFQKHEDKKYHKEFVVQKTKTYDSGDIKGKKPKKKQKSPEVRHTYYDDDYIPAATASPPVTATKALDNAPEIVYEINSPNYKETINEKAVSYNKETNSEPVHYTYGTNTHEEPVHYSYTHSSKAPLTIQEVHYEGKGEGPKHLIYNSNPEELNKKSEKPDDSGEYSEHSEGDGRPRSHQPLQNEHHSTHDGSKLAHYVPDHREKEYKHRPSSDSRHNEHKHHHKSSSEANHGQHEHHHKPSSNHHQNEHHNEQKHHHKPSSATHHEHHHVPSSKHNKNNYHNEQEHHQNVHNTEQEHHHRPHSDKHHNTKQASKPEQYPALDVIPYQFEEDLGYAAPIKVDPNQHVQRGHPDLPHQPRSSPAEPQRSNPAHDEHHPETDSDSKSHHDAPSTYVSEKTKQVYIKEETPEDDESIGEQLIKSMFGKEEDKEQDFENAYKNAAFGFPAFHKPLADIEKDIYNPESYGVPHDHSVYNIDHAPFQQYQSQSDLFPKETRLSYKDARDKMKEDYFLDYSISKPESLSDRYTNKANYYKLYKNQKPEKYVAFEDDKSKQSAKLTALPYSYYPVQGDQMKQFFAQYKAPPFVFEYDYSKAARAAATTSKDNSAHASRPYQHYKMTHFVEPQFQYGFEPISIPRLLDSELTAVATNNSPESEKPGTRKKIYKENFYIKKTSMSNAGPHS